jgi:hypothetical protein
MSQVEPRGPSFDKLRTGFAQGAFAIPPFVKGRLGGIYQRYHKGSGLHSNAGPSSCKAPLLGRGSVARRLIAGRTKKRIATECANLTLSSLGDLWSLQPLSHGCAPFY